MSYKKLIITLEEIKEIRQVVFGNRYKSKSALLTKREIKAIEKFIDRVHDADLVIRDFRNIAL